MPNHRKQHPVCAHCGSHAGEKPYTVTFPRAHGSVSRDFCSRRCYARYEEAQALELSRSTTED